MKKGDILKLQNGQNVIIIKIKDEIITVKKAVQNTEKYKDYFGAWQGVGKLIEFKIDQIKH